jgi:hypothetical protein
MGVCPQIRLDIKALGPVEKSSKSNSGFHISLSSHLHGARQMLCRDPPFGV